MSDKKIPISRNFGLPHYEGEPIKPQTAIEKIISFCKGLHEFQYAPFTMNFSVRGNFISIYLPIDPMIDLVNRLAAENLMDWELKDWYEQKGYSPTDFYFRRFGYDIRIARYKEKHENNRDVAWLQKDYGKQISDLKQALSAAVSLMEYHKLQAELLRQSPH